MKLLINFNDRRLADGISVSSSNFSVVSVISVVKKIVEENTRRLHLLGLWIMAINCLWTKGRARVDLVE